MDQGTQAELPGSSSSRESGIPGASRPNGPMARNLACLGSTLTIKGEISGDEDLQIDGNVEGPISLPSHRLTVGRTAHLSSEVKAREVIVYGAASGNLRARDRVEIKKDGELFGDNTAAPISVEDGASLKGRIEIERTEERVQTDSEPAGVSIGAITS